MKIPVNSDWLMYIWSPIAEGQETSDITMINMDDEKNIKIMSDNHLAEYFFIMNSGIRLILSVNWKYAIESLSDHDLIYGLDSVLPPFNIPSDIRYFYTVAYNRLVENRVFSPDLEHHIYLIHGDQKSPWDYADELNLI